MKVKFKAMFRGELCEVLMINFQSNSVGLRLVDTDFIRVGDSEPNYTQKVVPMEAVDKFIMYNANEVNF